MTEEAIRTVETEVDYADVTNDPNAFFMKVVDAVTGDEILDVVEANAVDGWFYQYAREGDGRQVTERYIDDRGINAKRHIRHRVEQAIAIVFKDEAPANLRQEFRLKAQ